MVIPELLEHFRPGHVFALLLDRGVDRVIFPPAVGCFIYAQAFVAGLALPVELQDEELTQAYNRWVESNVLEPLRVRAPETYAAVVEYIRSFINSVAEDKDD